MPEDPPCATKVHESDFFLFTGLKAHGRSGRDIQPHTTRSITIENQRSVNFKEMKMAAHLNRPVTRVLDQRSCCAAPGVGFDLPRFNKVFAWMHGLIPRMRPDAEVRPYELLPNRIVNGDELSAIRESGFQ